jgi:hypothetical protein
MTNKTTNDHLKRQQTREEQEFKDLKARLEEAAQNGSTTGSAEMDELHQETQSRIKQAQLRKPEGGTTETNTDTNQPYQNHEEEWVLPSVEKAIKQTTTGESFADIFNKQNS